MKDVIEQLIDATGPCLSSDLITILVQRHGLSATAARKRIARRPAHVKSLDFLPFPKNAKFIYHQNDYGAPRFWRALTTALTDSSPAYSCALQAIGDRGGILPRRHFSIACGASMGLRGHVSSETILLNLIQAQLLEMVEVPGVGECVAYAKGADYLDQPIAAMKARLPVEDIVLSAIKEWARNLALGSYGKFALRDDMEPPQVGTFAWDMSAPSYLGALTTRSATGAPNPGFLVCDILIGRTLSEGGLRPFLKKCETLRNLRKVGRCLQVFVADGYSESAFKLARSSGIVPATPETLFGEEVAAALLELSKILKEAAAAAVDPAKFDYLFTHLKKIEGASSSLRGALFELVVADIVRKLWPVSVTMNHIFRDGGKDVAEVDVLAIVPNRRIHFIECKGHAPNRMVDDDEIEKWLTKRIPMVRKKALENIEWRQLEMHFELWTSGQLSEAARLRIENLKIRQSAYRVTVRTGIDIENLCAATNDRALSRVVQHHFLEHPLSAAPRYTIKTAALTATTPVAAGSAVAVSQSRRPKAEL